MPEYTFEVICDNLHHQTTVTFTTTTEFEARRQAIEQEIRDKKCKQCNASLRFSFDGNPMGTFNLSPPKSR